MQLFDSRVHTYDLGNLLRRNHPLAQGLQWFGVAVPGLMGGATFHNLGDMPLVPPKGRHGTLVSMQPAFRSQASGWAAAHDAFSLSQSGGSTALPPAPLMSGALRFDGAPSYVTIADTPSLKLVNVFTIAFWLLARAQDGPIISKLSNGANSTGNDLRGIRLQASNTLYVTEQGANPLSISLASYVNKWVHVTLVSAAGGSQLYLNGTLATTGAQLTQWFNNTGPVRLGASEATNWFFTAKGTSFQGALNGVMLYNRALAAATVRALYLESFGYPTLLNRLLAGESDSDSISYQWPPTEPHQYQLRPPDRDYTASPLGIGSAPPRVTWAACCFTDDTLPGTVALASDVRALVSQDLEDQGVRFSDALFLRQLARAQDWVTIRYQLLRITFGMTTAAQVPFYAVSCLVPRLVVITHVSRGDGTTLWPVALAQLRYADPAWAQTPGTPQQFYRIGWRYLGLRPVPTAIDTLRVTGLVVPTPVTALTDQLEIPASYVPELVLVTTGLLVMTQERRYQDGLRRVREGLRLPTKPPQPVTVVPSTPAEVR